MPLGIIGAQLGVTLETLGTILSWCSRGFNHGIFFDPRDASLWDVCLYGWLLLCVWSLKNFQSGRMSRSNIVIENLVFWHVLKGILTWIACYPWQNTFGNVCIYKNIWITCFGQIISDAQFVSGLFLEARTWTFSSRYFEPEAESLTWVWSENLIY